MAESSNIAWTTSTFNPWIGCTKVSPGCDQCYAEVQDARGRWDGGRKHWGAGVPRYRTSAANWNQPLRWNRLAETQTGKSGRWLVFCASLADVFDNEVPEKWRDDLYDLIWSTPRLTWLILTKRIGNVPRMLPGKYIVGNWAWPWRNVWLGASIVNQEEADRDIPKLLATPAAKRFVSYEPALGPVNFTPFLRGTNATEEQRGYCSPGGLGGGVGDRRGGPDMAFGMSSSGSVERGHEIDPVQTPTRGEQPRKISSDSGDVRWQESARAGASAGVATLQRPYSSRPDGQPQGRHEEKERAEQPGIGDNVGAGASRDQGSRLATREKSWGEGLSWVIVGGESGSKARPFDYDWARAVRDQCRAVGVAFFMKQTGTNHALLYERVQRDRKGADPAEWPEDLRVQEFPA